MKQSIWRPFQALAAFTMAIISINAFAADLANLKTDNTYLKEVIKKVELNPLTNTKTVPICICGGDGEGGWSCTPAGCDSNFSSGGKSLTGPSLRTKPQLKPVLQDLSERAICICGGDGEGGWECRPAHCDETAGAPAVLDRSVINQRTMDQRKLTTPDKRSLKPTP